jgi:hypothetical protein
VSASKPHWFRVDVNVFTNPKIRRAIDAGGWAAFGLWQQGLAHSTEHLTDGWVDQPWPRIWGHKPATIRTLIDTGIWFEVPITDASGWLINDYHEYQPSRQEWEAKSERQRKNAARRWSQ